MNGTSGAGILRDQRMRPPRRRGKRLEGTVRPQARAPVQQVREEEVTECWARRNRSAARRRMRSQATTPAMATPDAAA